MISIKNKNVYLIVHIIKILLGKIIFVKVHAMKMMAFIIIKLTLCKNLTQIILIIYINVSMDVKKKIQKIQMKEDININ